MVGNWRSDAYSTMAIALDGWTAVDFSGRSPIDTTLTMPNETKAASHRSVGRFRLAWSRLFDRDDDED